MENKDIYSEQHIEDNLQHKLNEEHEITSAMQELQQEVSTYQCPHCLLFSLEPISWDNAQCTECKNEIPIINLKNKQK